MATTYINFNNRMFEVSDSEILVWLFVARDVAERLQGKNPWFAHATSELTNVVEAGLAALYNFSWQKLIHNPQEVEKALDLCEGVIEKLESMGEVVPLVLLKEISKLTDRGLLFSKPMPMRFPMSVAKTMPVLLRGRENSEKEILPIINSPI